MFALFSDWYNVNDIQKRIECSCEDLTVVTLVCEVPILG